MRLGTENRRQTLSAACAGKLSARPACINMQAGLPHMELTWAAKRSTSRKSLR